VEVVRRAGLGDKAKILRQIERLEETGEIRQEIFQKIAVALQLDPQEVEQANRRDLEEYERWLDERVPMTLTVRMLPAVYVTEPVPAGLTTEQGIEWALERFHQKWKNTGHLTPWKLSLNLSRRQSVRICGEEGSRHIVNTEPGRPAAPQMFVGGRPIDIHAAERP
jgi:hypothetical protein